MADEIENSEPAAPAGPAQEPAVPAVNLEPAPYDPGPPDPNLMITLEKGLQVPQAPPPSENTEHRG
jgi:hypothetical protein